MNFAKILFAVAFITFNCVMSSHSLKCYVCNEPIYCANPILQECNDSLANNTRSYLGEFHVGVDDSLSGPNYECLTEYVQVGSAYIEKYLYKGCTYTNIKGCELPVRMFVTNYACHQCSEDGCNSDERI